ncbi:acid beta-fructofuranosidase [Vitis riparia]|uniref:acid beta-fructofuranosidase n=1 Tax=Vitis riparia TaxID=96939 RepID=UPI00155A999F|nr:acid beta-fructofuranosidase [Vitis riparia]
MADPNPARTFADPEDPIIAATVPDHYTPLLDVDPPAGENSRLPLKGFLVILSGLVLVGLLMALIGENGPSVSQDSQQNDLTLNAPAESTNISAQFLEPASRGPSAGVSEKSFRLHSGVRAPFPWSNTMLTWQRTGYHFQPEKNWMNDPNGPMFYGGWYHFFYQYNPDAAVWGNIVWGHAVSKDLIEWLHLPLAMVADQWYDTNGVWTGSATLLSDGQVIMLYTGATNESVQVQNLAYPADLSDPLLVDWVKYPGNPVLVPPPGIDDKDFRDPTTAWYWPDGKWRIAIGSKVNKTGISLVYNTEDFKKYELIEGVLHAVPGTGMWECVDLYPVSLKEDNGLDTSFNGPGVKHVLKASLDDDKNDYYAIGTYSLESGNWTPDNPNLDVGIGLRYDYGKFYASKTFYDQNKQRRILWGWIGETDGESADIKKGWASVQSIPRTVVFDKKTGTNILQWPVAEIKSLRKSSKKFDKLEVGPGSVVTLEVEKATQMDITAEFEIDKEALKRIGESDVEYSCRTSGGSAQRGELGPFGLLLLADEGRCEQTPVYFYVAKGTDGQLKTFFCTDESRSSLANDVDKRIFGSTVPVIKGEKLSMRILVDHSIIESFAQGGRTCITSRVYPTKAIYGAAQLYVFNNATSASITASIQTWAMKSAYIRPYSSHQES